MTKNSWFRMYHRIIDDEKIRLLSFEDRWHFVALCCLKGEGVLDDENAERRCKKMALKMGLARSEFEEAIRRLVDVELIDENGCPVAWNELQYKSDSSAERVRKYRKKRKSQGLPSNSTGYLKHWDVLMEACDGKCSYCGSAQNLCVDHVTPVCQGGTDELSNLTIACKECNSGKAGRTPEQAGMKTPVTVTVTPQDTDTDTDTDTEKKQTKKTPRQELETVLDSEHAQAVLDHRQRIRKPLSAYAAKLLAGKFSRCPDPGQAADAMIANGWQGFEPEWLENRQATGRQEREHPNQDIIEAFARIGAGANQ